MISAAALLGDARRRAARPASTSATAAGTQEVAPRVGQRRSPPGDHRADARQQHEHERQRHRVAVEPRRPDGRLLAGHRLGDQREERAPEDDEGQPDEHEVVAQEDGLARQQRVEPVLGAQRVAPRRRRGRSSPRSSAAISDTNGTPSVDAPKAWIESRMPERTRNVPEDRERAGGEDQRGVPDLQHPALLLHHHRVQERGAGQPRQQRGVLDRVPGPVAAPAELGVGPARAEQDADAEEEPRGQREAARRRGSTPRRRGAR